MDAEVANPYQSTSESKVSDHLYRYNSISARFYLFSISRWLRKIAEGEYGITRIGTEFDL